MENLLSDAVLVAHFAWILFIILGFPASLLFTLIRLRIFHTAAMIFTIIMQATRTLCPLTLLEEALRRSTDAAFSYEGSFIITWLRKLIYIEDIGVSQAPGAPFDIAYIKVGEVLKNELRNRKIQKGDTIPLSMPSAKGTAVSTNIRYRKGTEGVWILEYKDETFWATYPKDYQPMRQKAHIAGLIREQANPNEPDTGNGK